MSHLLISRSPDLRRLRDEGYRVEIASGYLILHDIPYVDSTRKVRIGALASELTLSGDITARPSTHVVFFCGTYPCSNEGVEIAQIRHQSVNERIREGLIATFSFSNKPPGGYANYYDKMVTYATLLSGPAEAIDPNATPKQFAPIELVNNEAVFCYLDTASSRAGIAALTDKLKQQKIGIIGLGGTGSYVLDYVAKSPVLEIHLFDGDLLLQHNAFRCPGAVSIEDLRQRVSKVEYFERIYRKVRRGIIPHPEMIQGSNVSLLDGLSFVFLCLDRGDVKRAIVEKLIASGIPFVDVGMGLSLVEPDSELIGILRVTACNTGRDGHLDRRGVFADGGENEYARNIQVSELNALNAAMAVIKWKKMVGFYQDLEKEYQSAFVINTNSMINDEL